MYNWDKLSSINMHHLLKHTYVIFSNSKRTAMQGLTVESNDMGACPPGVRFLPNDIEVLHYYLKNKLEKKPLPPVNIRDVDIYQFNPEDLAGMYKPTCDKPEEWYFFTPRDRKHRNGKRLNRKAGDGFWRATGADKEVKMNGTVIGWKKALVFYFGKPPNGEKTSWIMHEYTLRDAPPSSTTGSDDMKLDVFVLCKIHKHTRKSDTKREQDTSGNKSLSKFQN
ncbi:hypothetical protein K2173_020048 [Erythroxylum novogranatense]|uniref:NAC domain-containing protein n=1 Tax=Erythroxylum novogranatense TaxID=1862640 RepID=A0AAV8UA39_9ROSI|nr:hypothetical protein K2173_020048 [Erythroxylum novogranatense]